MTPLVRPVFHRCGPTWAPAVQATRPRGRVRPQDVDRLRVDLGFEAEDSLFNHDGSLTVEFRVGDSVLGKVELPALYDVNTLAIPAALRKQMDGVRGCIRWGRFDHESPAATTGFWLEEPSRTEQRRFSRIDRALAAEPLWIRQVIRAQALLDARYDSAALDEAMAALRTRTDEPHAHAIVGLARRLLGMQSLDDHHGLKVRLREVFDARSEPGAPTDCDLKGRLSADFARRLPRARGGCGGR